LGRGTGATFLGLILRTLREQVLVNVRDDTTRSDMDIVQQLVKLFVVPDRQHDVSWDDTDFLVVSRGVASQLKDFGSEVLEHRSQVHRSTNTDTLRELTFFQVPVKEPKARKRRRVLERNPTRAGPGPIALVLFSQSVAFTGT